MPFTTDVQMSFLRIFICTKGENKVHIVISLEVNKSGSK